MAGGQSTTERGEMVEIRRAKGDKGTTKKEGRENKKMPRGGGGQMRRKGGEGAEAKRKEEGESCRHEARVQISLLIAKAFLRVPSCEDAATNPTELRYRIEIKLYLCLLLNRRL